MQKYHKQVQKFQSTLSRRERHIYNKLQSDTTRFQSTLSRRERQSSGYSYTKSYLDFNPRSHEESDLVCYRSVFSIHKFQSTLSRRERQMYFIFHYSFLKDFNPRSHEESDLKFWHGNANEEVFQSTLSRRERPMKKLPTEPVRMISIHALTKRATYDSLFWEPVFSKISIHALTKRATSFFRQCLFSLFNFNPRSHEESDHCI